MASLGKFGIPTLWATADNQQFDTGDQELGFNRAGDSRTSSKWQDRGCFLRIVFGNAGAAAFAIILIGRNMCREETIHREQISSGARGGDTGRGDGIWMIPDLLRR